MARRGGRNKAAEWSGRLAGVVLCAFFALGLFAGLSAPGHEVAARSRELVTAYGRRMLAPAPRRSDDPARAVFARPAGTVALVARSDGFYALSPEGGLRGPVAPNAEGDVPVLSGSGLKGASAAQLLEYAALLVRAEAALSALISELRVNGDGTGSLFLARSRTEIIVDVESAPLELRRAAELLTRWRGRHELIAMLDMTTPGQAVMRLHAVALAARERKGATQRVAARTTASRTREPAGR